MRVCLCLWCVCDSPVVLLADPLLALLEDLAALPLLLLERADWLGLGWGVTSMRTSRM